MAFLAMALVTNLAAASRLADDWDRLTQEMKWRCIGPHRGGRTVGAVGIPGKPNEFLIGVNNGGVWKTMDYGRTWVPIFDSQPTGSVGWVTVAPSDPETVYVGCGEGLQRPDLSVGDGVYKSTDGGKTWQNVGLQDGEQIPCIVVDPRDKERVFVAVLGHPYGPNPTRGLYRTLDGGKTWRKVLGPDDDTGASQVVLDPENPEIVYCSLWAARQAPWENGAWQGPECGLYKSTDGGETWKPVMHGMPSIAQGLGRIGIAIAPSDPDRIYATVDADQGGGVYRSDDGATTWRRISEDGRLWGRGDDFAEVKVDPKDSDTVYCANTCTYKSTDGGKTWAGWKGAPGGDDYHTIWIDPDNPRVVLLAADQGATLTVNGGETWSSWYNQPTAQFYHVSTDNQWPYWVYGGQQESGSVGIASRGNDGQITFREWHPVGVEEYGYVAVDPLDPNIVYGGKITKYDKRTGQVQDVSPAPRRGGAYRFLRTAPVLFSPVDPHLLYFAGNVLFATKDGGHSWDVLSPDLSREKPDVPESFRGLHPRESGQELDLDDPDRPQHGPNAQEASQKKPLAVPGRRGVIYSVAPSNFTTQTIWCGTDDGLVWLTRDGGKNWEDVSPPGLTSWSKVSQIDAGHFSDGTAYVAVNRIRCDDQKPYIYVTHDAGKSWRLAVNGLPDDPVNAVREDPVRKGLLYCATERMVHYSLDDGASWRSLRLNMPCTSVRDLVVKDDDLVIGTHGRSFWILDDVTPLRQVPGSFDEVALFEPQRATRVRWNMNTDTPLPPEEPGGQNPPDGAVIDYWLPKDAGHVTLEVLDAAEGVVRRYSSDDKPFSPDPDRIPLPTYWLRPPSVLARAAGGHRWLWDMRFDPLEPFGGWVPMQAIVHDTPAVPLGPWAPPGQYSIRLTVDGKSWVRPLTLRLDPRLQIESSTLETLDRMTVTSYLAVKEIDQTVASIKTARNKIAELLAAKPDGAKAVELKDLDAKLARLEQTPDGQTEPSLASVRRSFAGVLGAVSESEMAPTRRVEEAFAGAAKEWRLLRTAWKQFENDPLMGGQ